MRSEIPASPETPAAETTALLVAGEPAPVAILRAGAPSDIVVLADHAGRLIPRDLGTLGLAPSDLDRHIAYDIGIAGVAEGLSAALDATAILQRYSRLVIDCNRPPGVASSIPARSEATDIPGNRNVSPDDALVRRRALFDPYHARIAAELDLRHAAGRKTVLILLHSFTPVFLGEARPMHAAVLYNRDDRLAMALLALLRREDGLIVGDNEPYRVAEATDYAAPVHGEKRGLLHVEIEVRQDLITTEVGQAEWAARLARLVPDAIAAAP